MNRPDIEPEILDWIRKDLALVEREHGVKILHACEAGSRAWGFESTDSDYDVRFLYIHPRDWYLSIDLEKKRDVIELPVGTIDMSGWDFRKALQLLRKSNPPLLEHLKSPIVYKEHRAIMSMMRAQSVGFYSPSACAYHYLHMARGNVREYLRGDTVWRKKYLYVIRPLLAVKWIELGLGQVPVRFDDLAEKTVFETDLALSIDNLIAEKKAGVELGRGPKDNVINGFIEAELSRLESSRFAKRPDSPDLEPLNTLFRDALAGWDLGWEFLGGY